MFKTISMVLLALPILLSGCATITHDANQTVQIETYSKDNQLISGAKCTAKNERGQWSTTSTGNVTVHRSADNLIVTCDKDGESTGHGTAISRANGGMFGNILIGGGIGAIIDHNKGTAYNYPTWLKIIMGENLIFDRKDQVGDAAVAGKPSDSSVKTAAVQTTEKTVEPSTEQAAK